MLTLAVIFSDIWHFWERNYYDANNLQAQNIKVVMNMLHYNLYVCHCVQYRHRTSCNKPFSKNMLSNVNTKKACYISTWKAYNWRYNAFQICHLFGWTERTTQGSNHVYFLFSANVQLSNNVTEQHKQATVHTHYRPQQNKFFQKK